MLPHRRTSRAPSCTLASDGGTNIARRRATFKVQSSKCHVVESSKFQVQCRDHVVVYSMGIQAFARRLAHNGDRPRSAVLRPTRGLTQRREGATRRLATRRFDSPRASSNVHRPTRRLTQRREAGKAPPATRHSLPRRPSESHATPIPHHPYPSRHSVSLPRAPLSLD